MSRLSWYYALTCLMLAASLAATRPRHSEARTSLAKPLSGIPTEINGWNGSDDPPLPGRILQSLGATSVLSRTYRRGGQSLELFIAYYANPRAGETMHSPKHCLPGGGWEPLDVGTVTVKLGEQVEELNKYLLYKQGQRALVIYWYQTPSRVIASEYLSKLYLIWDTLTGTPKHSSIVRLTLQDRPGGLDDALAFAARLIPEVARCYGAGPWPSSQAAARFEAAAVRR